MEQRHGITLGDSGKLAMWCIFERPLDYPQGCIARLFELDKPTHYVVTAPDVEVLRDKFRGLGLTRLPRAPEDPPFFLESWV